jgi:enoyl-CoA hydratase
VKIERVRSPGAQLLACFIRTLNSRDGDSEPARAKRKRHAPTQPFAGSRNEDDARLFGHAPIISIFNMNAISLRLCGKRLRRLWRNWLTEAVHAGRMTAAMKGVNKMTFENLVVEKRGPVAVVTVNRPEKLNALNIQTREEIVSALEELRDNDEIRVVVFTGAGDKAFIAGADINEFAGKTALEQRAIMKNRRTFDSVEDFPKPVIAMINGYALGGGCELAMACDIRVASTTAKLGQPEIKLGIIPGGGGTQRLPRLVGEGKAMELILTGDMISAEEAERLGLVNYVVPPEQLEKKTMEVAARIAEMSPVAVSMAKQAVKNSARLGLIAGLEAETELFSLCFGSQDKEEGVRAFLEKRKPDFKGR